MASIRKELRLNVPADVVWDAVRDVGAVHKRLCPGVLTDTRLEKDARIVTFANGMTSRELSWTSMTRPVDSCGQPWEIR